MSNPAKTRPIGGAAELVEVEENSTVLKEEAELAAKEMPDCSDDRIDGTGLAVSGAAARAVGCNLSELEEKVSDAKAALDAAREAAQAAHERLEKIATRHAVAMQTVNECEKEVSCVTKRSALAMTAFIDEEGTEDELEAAREDLEKAKGRLKKAKRLADALAAELDVQKAQVQDEPRKIRDIRYAYWSAVFEFERARLIQLAGDAMRRVYFLDRLSDEGKIKTRTLADAAGRAFSNPDFGNHDRLATIEALEREYGDLYPGVRK